MPSRTTRRGLKAAKSSGSLDGRLSKLFEALREKYGGTVVMTADQYEDPGRLPTGIPDLDRILGGGWPKGRLSEIWGPQGSGKTTMLLATIAAVQRLKPDARIAYFDLENTFGRAWAERHGVDLSRVVLIKAIPAEEVGELILTMVRQQWDMVVIDSVVELLPEKELAKKLHEDSVAPVARLLGKLLPKIITLQSVSPTVVLIVNQVRDDIGSRASFYLGGGSKAPGGQALHHLDSLRLRVQRKEFIRRGGVKVGFVTAVKVVKSKVSKEQAETRFAILFDQGVVADLPEGDDGGGD